MMSWSIGHLLHRGLYVLLTELDSLSGTFCTVTHLAPKPALDGPKVSKLRFGASKVCDFDKILLVLGKLRLPTQTRILSMHAVSRGFRLTEEGVQQVKSKMTQKGLSNEQLAEMASCSQATLKRLTNQDKVSGKLLNKVLSILNFDATDKVRLIEDYPAFMTFIEGDNTLVSRYREEAVQAISEAKPSDIQVIASAQIGILDSYHKEALQQAKKSFRWALRSSIAGFGLFLIAVFFLLPKQPKEQAIIPLVGGAFVEVIAGINFYLYGRTTRQMSSFHHRLDRTQRFLLANSICESIEGELKQATRAELVRAVSSFVEKEAG
jgi:transcriptional regulator with XRE-family HTH domain